MPITYKELVFTTHAWDRATMRSVTAADIWSTVTSPHKQFAEANETTKFIKSVRGRRLHVIAKKILPDATWLVISVWVRGEDDPVPLAWQLITFPFKVCWFILRWLYFKLAQTR